MLLHGTLYCLYLSLLFLFFFFISFFFFLVSLFSPAVGAKTVVPQWLESLEYLTMIHSDVRRHALDVVAVRVGLERCASRCVYLTWDGLELTS